MDDSENWSVTPFRGNQLLTTLTHELGHSLGLRHSSVGDSIMAPSYRGWTVNIKLGQDDKEGIQSLYGQPPTQSKPNTGNRPTLQFPIENRPLEIKPTEITPTEITPAVDTENRPTPFPAGNRPVLNFPGSTPEAATPREDDNLCDSKLDAIVETSAGISYVFRGSSYWMLTKDSVAPGYPRLISEDWPGLPHNIDAALTWKTRGVTYFFKRDKYWRFTDRTPSLGYPRDISDWSGLPANLDAAFEFGQDGHLYFFKLSSYWKYDTELGQMSAGYPRDISDWTNIPHNVDAAFTWRNGKTYFFKSGEYWRYADDGDLDRNNQPFPRDAGQWWFGCSQTSIRRQPFVDYNDDFVEVGFKGPTK